MRTLLLVVVIALLAVGAAVAWYLTQTSANITNFDECAAAGYPIAQSVPRQCRTPDGKTFIETDSAQMAIVPSRIEKVSVDSGLQENRGTEPIIAFREVVRSPGAPWLQVLFGEHNLGKRSFVTVTSLKDGDSQSLNSQTLREWNNGTAFFNGDAAEVTLTVAPGESGIFFRIKEIFVGVVGDFPGEPPGGTPQESL